MRKKLKIILIHVIYTLSWFFPRNKQKFICIGWHKTVDGEIVADNAKYFFLHLSEKKSVRPIWLAKSTTVARELRAQGFESFYEKSFLGIWHLLTAGFIVIDAFLQPQHYMLSGHAKILQLLHGKGMKKKGYSEQQLRSQDMIFSTSPFSESILPENFKKGATLAVTGYSRNDQFFKTINGSTIGVPQETLNRLQVLKRKGVTTIFYAPTFRRGEKEFQFNSIDKEKLRAWAQTNNAHVLLSLHNKYRKQQVESVAAEGVSTLIESDIYPLFPFIDILVTDYSSSFVDFLLLERPLVFYPYDFETYSEREGIVGDYSKITPGPKAYTFESLLTELENAIKQKGMEWKEKRKEIRDLYHTYQDGNSSERIWRAIKEKYAFTE